MRILAIIIILSFSSNALADMNQIEYKVDQYSVSAYQKLKQFVADIKAYGFNYFKAKRFTAPNSLGQLERMLNDGNYSEYKHYLTGMIGLIGDKAAFDSLNNYVAMQNGNASPNILQSYGFLARNNDDALNKLVGIATKGDQKNEFSDYSGYGGPSAPALAIQALGISGRQDAMKILEELKNPNNSNYRADLQKYVEFAINLNEKIQRKGYDSVYNETFKSIIPE